MHYSSIEIWRRCDDWVLQIFISIISYILNNGFHTNCIKGRGTWKIYADFIGQILSLDGETHVVIYEIFEIH